MLKTLWQTLFGSGERPAENIETVQMKETRESMQTSVSEPRTPEDEIEVLARYCGGLAKGKVIKIGLHEILDIIPRKRKKADAYYALKKQLRDEYGVEIVIESRASKQKEKEL